MKLLFSLLLITGFLYSSELDELLNVYTHNSDLSQKTKVENGGVITIFTRKDIDIMQARKLKDIMKSNPLKRYTESRSGVPDLMYNGGMAPYVSSSIRVYINNQELNSAAFGSAFALIGNMSLESIDHIEIYSNSPSYEFTTEPTYLLIKLYTKIAERDGGGKLGFSYGSLGFNEETLSYAEELENFSYYTSIFRTDNKKKTHYSHNIPINRDNERSSVLASIYSEKHNFLVTAIKENSDLFISTSPTATHETSDGSFNYILLGYDTNVIDNFTFSISSHFADYDMHTKDTNNFLVPLLVSPEIEVTRNEHTVSTELKYNLESQNNRLIVGAKFRHKYFETESAYVGGVLQSTNSYNTQNVSSVFFEERYNFSENNIINLAAHYSHVDNNSYVDNAELLQLRLAHTYLYNDFVFKTFAFHVESLVEPYIYTDVYNGLLKPQKLNAISEEIKYNYGISDYRLFLTYETLEDAFMEEEALLFTNSEDKHENLSAYLEYTNNFNYNNKIIANISHSYSYGMPTSKRETAAFIRSLNSIGSFDIFNEVIYNHNNITDKNYFDYSAGVKYSHSNSLTLSIKGENIFNKGYEESYLRYDPDVLPLTLEEPLLISPIEQRFYVTVEYMF